jgi:hypothetical protein
MNLTRRQEKNARLYSQAFPEVRRLRVRRADSPTKRFTAEFEMGGRAHKVNFGQPGATTYSDIPEAQREHDIDAWKKRIGYMARASKITNSRGELTYKVPGTANSFSFWILWQ